MKSTGTAVILLIVGFFGFCGLHRIYVGKVGTGILWLLTGGLCLIGQIIDIFLIDDMVRLSNVEHQL